MNLYYHFIHLYFLSEFEILFYIYYIMPYEKDLILNLLKVDDIPQIYNFSFSLDLSKCSEYQDQSNHKLWNMCVYYLIAINAILFLLFCRDLLQNYVLFGETINVVRMSPKYNNGSSLMAFGSGNNLFEQKKNDDIEIEMRPLSKKVLEEEPRETWFAVYYWKKSAFFAEFCKTVQFIILVAIFEYLFFKLVVNKYKILDQKTLLCDLVRELVVPL
jgi:hypothetical protein